MKAKEIRAKAWNNLRGVYWWVFLLLFVATLIVTPIESKITIENAETLRDLGVFTQEIIDSFIELGVIVNRNPLVSSFVSLVATAQFLISGVLRYGEAKVMIKVGNGKNATFNDLFSGFRMFGRLLALNLLIAIYTFLWSLLFVIPGIVKMYSYSQAYYIAVEHPEYSAKECITASRVLMDGNKWRLFCLDFSFIGWIILASLTGIGGFFLAPYMNQAKGVFYNMICEEKGEHKVSSESEEVKDVFEINESNTTEKTWDEFKDENDK